MFIEIDLLTSIIYYNRIILNFKINLMDTNNFIILKFIIITEIDIGGIIMATANIGFEETLWKSADKLRGSMDSSEYKYVVLGLIFVKYISDKFESKYRELVEEGEGFEEDRDEYESENIFWVPKEARWEHIKNNAKNEKIGQIIDDAMILIEHENPTLRGVLEKRYARPEIDKRRLGELIDLISTIKLHENGEKDLLGRVYEYFLGQFASAEGKMEGNSTLQLVLLKL